MAQGFGALFSAFVGVLLFVWFARFLYKRKIFCGYEGLTWESGGLFLAGVFWRGYSSTKAT